EFMTTTTSLESVIIHELGHILGVGTIWRDDHRDLARPSQAHCLDANHEPHVTRTFAGPRGVNEHHALGAAGQPPLDQNCAHWSEQRFQTEVLTPSITISSDGNNHQPLSRMTIGALEDIGYVVDY